MRMKTSALVALLPLFALLLSVKPAAAQVTPTTMPTGVTPKMISDGGGIFKGAGLCFACHGQDAKGMPGLGANLTDSEWIHIDGSYEKIVETITKGTTSSAGVAMPPKGGSAISEADVKALAAYVWSLSHPSREGSGR
ncbi:MAG: cytochrome c [Longimicrobiales bacterium]|nr:cytochrome c [Longimicrobiales bacterium]